VKALILSATALLVVAGSSVPAYAAGPPQIDATWVAGVSATSAVLHAEVNPRGQPTTYRFEYLTEAAWLANGEGFAGAARAPASGEAGLGEEEGDVPAQQPIAHLTPATPYRYRIVATNAFSSLGGTAGPARAFATEPLGSAAEECPNTQLRYENGSFELPDCRAYELVSPTDKNGGAVAEPGQIFGGSVLQAAAGGGAATFSSTASFGEAPRGAPPASQYVSRRGPDGWSTENITEPTVSGAYGEDPDGVPYQLFSGDLARGLLLNGRRCAEGEECPRSYSLRESESGTLAALPEEPGLHFAGASPDLRHVVLTATGGLYEWSAGEPLELLSAVAGARLAAQGAGAVSTDGSRAYFTAGGNLYLREGTETKQVDEEVGGGGEFQAASADGSVAYFTKGERLYRYEAQFEDLSTIDLTPGGEVLGVLGASADGSRVYYATASGLFLWQAPATTIEIAPGAEAAQASDWPPTTGTARVGAGGGELAFLSKASLTGYDNTDQSTGEPDTEVYLYEAGAGGRLRCASCNPTGERPLGPSSIPGAIANGTGEAATDLYKPRVLSADGARLFFDSADRLAPTDASAAQDVYEWEAAGAGPAQARCTASSPTYGPLSGGCLALISSGRSTEASTFIDASESGSDAFFLTADSLLATDPGSADLYDAREGGGFPVPETPTPCEGDACQAIPSPPEDPSPGTLVVSFGNLPARFAKQTCPKGRRGVRRHGESRCVARHHRRQHGHRRHRNRHHRRAGR
jgi:hypothetical protein